MEIHVLPPAAVFRELRRAHKHRECAAPACVLPQPVNRGAVHHLPAPLLAGLDRPVSTSCVSGPPKIRSVVSSSSSRKALSNGLSGSSSTGSVPPGGNGKLLGGGI